MRIAMFQMKNEGSVSANLEKSLRAMKEASDHHADLILFPEVQLTEFFPQYPGQDVRKYEVSMDSDIVKSFCRASRENRIMAVPNLYLSENGKPYDASLLIGRDGNILGIQKMVHVAQAPQFYEQDYYTPSDDGFKIIETEFGKIGIVVCFDRHYPESIRTEALRGADLILIPTVNTKAEPSEMFEWEIRVQAFQNSVAIAMCNRVGEEGAMQFSGESIVVDANGELAVLDAYGELAVPGSGVELAVLDASVKLTVPDASEELIETENRGKRIRKADDTEQIVYADIDPGESGRIRKSRPYTALRRPELYA